MHCELLQSIAKDTVDLSVKFYSRIIIQKETINKFDHEVTWNVQPQNHVLFFVFSASMPEKISFLREPLFMLFADILPKTPSTLSSIFK